jgi:hypothetical protein
LTTSSSPNWAVIPVTSVVAAKPAVRGPTCWSISSTVVIGHRLAVVTP